MPSTARQHIAFADHCQSTRSLRPSLPLHSSPSHGFAARRLCFAVLLTASAFPGHSLPRLHSTPLYCAFAPQVVAFPRRSHAGSGQVMPLRCCAMGAFAMPWLCRLRHAVPLLLHELPCHCPASAFLASPLRFPSTRFCADATRFRALPFPLMS